MDVVFALSQLSFIQDLMLKYNALGCIQTIISNLSAVQAMSLTENWVNGENKK